MKLKQLVKDSQEIHTIAHRHQRGLRRAYLCPIFTTEAHRCYQNLYQISEPTIPILEAVGSWGMMSDCLMSLSVVFTHQLHTMNKINGGLREPLMNLYRSRVKRRTQFTAVITWGSIMSHYTGQLDMNPTALEMPL